MRSITNARNKVALATLFSIICSYNYSCSKLKGKNISQLNLMVNYPITVIDKGKITFFNLTDTIYIFYYKDFIVYKLKPQRSLENNEKIKGTESYFCYEKDNKYGLFFKNSYNKHDSIKLPVDSLLTKEAFKSANFEVNNNLYLHEAVEENNKKELLEKYYFKIKNENLYDSIYYYYSSSFKNIEYSLSKTLDSAKHLKLYKARLMYNQKFSTQHNLMMPKREYSFEIKEVPFSNDSIIKQFFSRMELYKE